MKKLKNCNPKFAPKTGLFSPQNLNRIQIKNLPWVHSLYFSFPRQNKCRIKICFKIRERVTGKKSPLYSHRTVDMRLIKSNREILSHVRSVAKKGVTHEIDECIYFDDKRIFDPHRK